MYEASDSRLIANWCEEGYRFHVCSVTILSALYTRIICFKCKRRHLALKLKPHRGSSFGFELKIVPELLRVPGYSLHHSLPGHNLAADFLLFANNTDFMVERNQILAALADSDLHSPGRPYSWPYTSKKEDQVVASALGWLVQNLRRPSEFRKVIHRLLGTHLLFTNLFQWLVYGKRCSKIKVKPLSMEKLAVK